MRIQKKLLVIPAALLLAGASGVGFAHASTGGTVPQSLSVSADSHTADLQQGDQSTPDVAGATAEANAPESTAPETASTIDAPGGPDLQQGDQSTPDVAGATAEANAPETASTIDAPGGPDLQQGDQTGADTGN